MILIWSGVMNAIEFVKNCGVEEAKGLLDKYGHSGFYCHFAKIFNITISKSFCVKKDQFHTIDMSDLKQIVEAFELIDSYDGLSEANNWINNIISNGGMTNIQAANCELQKAINLVEQCQ